MQLITDAITEITPRRQTAHGKQYDADVIDLRHRFQANRFLLPMEVTGKGGVDLQTQWNGDPRAYLGITMPGFPNLFCLYGPNTNIVVNGSIIFFSECEMRYIMSCLKLLLERACRAGLPAGRARRVQQDDRCRQRADGLGRGERAQLVQERAGPRHAELASRWSNSGTRRAR